MSCHRAALTLLPKKGTCVNLRNVALICADYKIFAKVLANRLKSHLDSILLNHRQLVLNQGHVGLVKSF